MALDLKRLEEKFNNIFAKETEQSFNEWVQSKLEEAAAESPVEDEAVLLLKEVMNYHLGNGEYNFSRLPYNERENESFDAWQKIKAKIKIFLKKQL